jgi:hypothetical protein
LPAFFTPTVGTDDTDTALVTAKRPLLPFQVRQGFIFVIIHFDPILFPV